MAFANLQEKLGMTQTPHEVEAKLDNAVEDSFPASDPVSLSMPHDREELNLHRSTSPATMMLVGGGLLALIALIALRR
ncbi:MAG TPA: hypothetical protein VGP15_00365 [Burkholderiales bacterium]|jgi:hypothetical protein|nr:hypothetical protein [Burkholderiales bacterium]